MKRFTPEEDQFLRDNYLTIPTKRMSVMLGRSDGAARQRMASLGIKVPPEVADKFKRDSWIKPGSTPMNKGKKQVEYMSPESIVKASVGRFGKGNVPSNSKYDGYERISKDGYVEVRIRKGLFRLKHRVEWEKVNGPIPKKHLIVCLSDDVTDCRPENWELITMKENMRRNSATLNLSDGMVATYMATRSRKVNETLKAELLHKYPDLIQAKRMELLINRKIKQHGQK